MIGRLIHRAWAVVISAFVIITIVQIVYNAYTTRNFHNGFWLGALVGAVVVFAVMLYVDDET